VESPGSIVDSRFRGIKKGARSRINPVQKVNLTLTLTFARNNEGSITP